MITYLELENFKSFDKVRIDLTGKAGKPKTFALIYGENGSGKSNLMSSMFFLSETFETFLHQKKINELNQSDLMKSLNKIDDDELKKDLIAQIVKSNLVSLSELIKAYMPVNAKGKIMSVKIGFYFNGKNGEYWTKYSSDSIIFEQLSYVISQRMGVLFSISEDKSYFSPSIFYRGEYFNELQALKIQYWGIHSFVSILFNEYNTKNKEFMEKGIHNNLFDVINHLHHISVLYKHGNSQKACVSIPFKFLENLESGIVESNKDKELLTFESILNIFFTQLYADIKQVYYEFKETDQGYKYQLFENKLMNNEIVRISFRNESTGTRKLLELFPFFFSAMNGETIFVDEMDSGIHDLLMLEVVEALSASLKGQFIATTHNTTLMKNISPDNVYFINSDATGSKEIIPATDYGVRIQKTNNLQHKYLNGDFGGIPNIGDLDFEDVMSYVDDLKQGIE